MWSCGISQCRQVHPALRRLKGQPKNANYHFTTLSPNLGVVYVGEGSSFVMADIPGIIEGASQGAGLGHDFLRHIDRCRLMVHVVDASGLEGRDPIEDFEAINRELEEYSPELASRPMIVAANKCDVADEEQISRLAAYVEERGMSLFRISAATHQGVRELVAAIAAKLAELPPIVTYEPDFVDTSDSLDNSDPDIVQEDGCWYISGGWVERLVENINFSDYESRMYFDRVLRDRGIFDRLEELGVQEGDTVDVCGAQFEYRR